MLIIGIICIVAAIILIAVGITNAAVSALLWIGIAVAVVALVLVGISYSRGRSSRL